MKDSLKAVIADYLAVDSGAVPDTFRFSGERFQGSVGMYRFQAFAQKRLGRRLPAIPYGSSLNETLSLLGGTTTIASAPAEADPGAPLPMDPAAMAASAAAAGPEGAAVGLDIEAVSSMPPTEDYRSHEFYQSAFTPQEMAYCILKPEPRIHFCGLFSAKESLKKASAVFLELPLHEIEIGHDGNGKPHYLRAGGISRPAFSLSISHTPENAVAIALALAAQTDPAPALSSAPEIPAGNAAVSKAGSLRDTGSLQRLRIWNAVLSATVLLGLIAAGWLWLTGHFQ